MSRMRNAYLGPLQKHVREITPLTPYAAGGWIGKMRGIEHGAVVRALREQALSGGAGFGGLLVGEERDIGPYELDRMVNDIAHERRPRTVALGIHDDAAG